MKSIVLGVVCLSLISCRTTPSTPTTTTVQSAPAAVTRLESPTAIEPTQLETIAKPPTTTTTTEVQKAITDLKAQRTSEGLKVELPENILFDFDKAEIRPSAKPTLQKLSLLLKTYQNSPTEIRGYMDSKGSDRYNQDLSERRAKAVEAYLVENFQVKDDRLTPKGFGKTQPIALNTKSDGSDDPEGRQKNRRVEVIIRNTAP